MQGRRRRGQRGVCPSTFKSFHALCAPHVFVAPPPTFAQPKCSYFAIFSHLLVKNAKFPWLASLANFTLLIFSKRS